MKLPFKFDFKNPNYFEVFQYRYERLRDIMIQYKRDPGVRDRLFAYYAQNPVAFIEDWGTTYEPRNIQFGLPALIPIVLPPIQEDMLHWLHERFLTGESGVIKKSRDMMVTTGSMAYLVTMCIFRKGFNAGIGSRKEEYVDSGASPKSLMYKCRSFMNFVPPIFKENWNEKKHSPFRQMRFVDSGSIISGESGDGIGRGDRTSFYFVDEHAWLPRADETDASLSATANTIIYASSVHGSNNSFARKCLEGKIPMFVAYWKDDPRKDQAWRDRMERELDPVVIAQEIEMDFNASLENVFIEYKWLQACVDAHLKLGLVPTGRTYGALDIADEGRDKNAYCSGQEFLITHLESWTGKNSDIYATCEKAMRIADSLNDSLIRFDSDGLGAGARGDFRKINEERVAKQQLKRDCIPYRGSGEVIDKEGEVFPKKPGSYDFEHRPIKNEDYFKNAKAQAWFHLRQRAYETYQYVVNKIPCSRDKILSIASTCPDYQKLIQEIAQVTAQYGEQGRMVIDKKPNGALSPNLADSVVIYFAKLEREFDSAFIMPRK